MPTLKPSHFKPVHTNQVNFDPIQKPRQFRSLHWNQVNFDLSYWNQVNFDHPHKNQVNFDAPTKTMSFCDESVDAWRRSSVGAPPAPRPWSWTDDRTPEPYRRSISSGNATDSSFTSHFVMLQPRRYPPVNNPPRAQTTRPQEEPISRTCHLTGRCQNPIPDTRRRRYQKIRWWWYRECLSLELQPRKMSKKFLPYPAVPEKLNVDNFQLLHLNLDHHLTRR